MSGGRAPSGVQGQSPWSGAGGEAPLKLKSFLLLLEMLISDQTESVNITLRVISTMKAGAENMHILKL